MEKCTFVGLFEGTVHAWINMALITLIYSVPLLFLSVLTGVK